MSYETYRNEYIRVAKRFCKKYGYEFIEADPFAITLKLRDGLPQIRLGWYDIAKFLAKETDEGDD